MSPFCRDIGPIEVETECRTPDGQPSDVLFGELLFVSQTKSIRKEVYDRKILFYKDGIPVGLFWRKFNTFQKIMYAQ